MKVFFVSLKGKGEKVGKIRGAIIVADSMKKGCNCIGGKYKKEKERGRRECHYLVIKEPLSREAETLQGKTIAYLKAGRYRLTEIIPGFIFPSEESIMESSVEFLSEGVLLLFVS